VLDGILHAYFGTPEGIAVYLDNGAFAFLSRGGGVPGADYEAFVAAAGPDWYAVPQDYIPTPRMEDAEQLRCQERTMAVNRAYGHDGPRWPRRRGGQPEGVSRTPRWRASRPR
jgi:7-cyano-7-deazaguanine tRNA-ribosyltransferase